MEGNKYVVATIAGLAVTLEKQLILKSIIINKCFLLLTLY